MEVLSEITEDVGNGVTDPVRGLIGDKRIVAKYIENDEGFISLFNELLGYNLACYFGIRHPEFGCAVFDEKQTKVKNDKSYKNNSLFSYTVWLKKSLPITSPNMTLFVDESEITNLLLFDIFIYNTDRNLGNMLVELPSKLFPIDYTHILPGRCIWTDILKNNDYSIKSIIEDMFSSGYYQYLIENRSIMSRTIEKSGAVFLEKIKLLKIDEIYGKIPRELIERLDKSHFELLETYFSYMTANFEDAIIMLKSKLGKEWSQCIV